MTVAAYDPFVAQKNAPDGVRMLDLDELLATSDFVTVHVPLSDETRGLLSRERLFGMKRGARLIDATAKQMADQFFADFASAVARQQGVAPSAAPEAQKQEAQGLLQRLIAWFLGLWR